jgi:hypothetical protein
MCNSFDSPFATCVSQNETTEMETASRTAPPEPNKEPAGDALGDVHSQGHAIVDGTSCSADTRKPAEDKDIAVRSIFHM